MKPSNDLSPKDDAPDMPWDCDYANPPLDDARIQELTNDLLVHALLVGRFQDTPELASERVNRVCLAFERSLWTTRWYWKAGLSTAAAAVVILTLVLFFLPTQNVQAQLSQVLDTFDIGDKTYQVDISEDTNQPLPDAGKGWMRPLRRPAFKPARGRLPAKRLDGALLYVRNRRQVLTYTLPMGLRIARGFDGQQGWMTHPWPGLPTGSDPNLLRAEIPEEAVSLLFVDLRGMLHQIRRNYAVSGPGQSPGQDGKAAVWYYVADRVVPRPKLPRQIELWADAKTGQLHDILCTGVSFHKAARRYVLRITLLDTAPLSSDWFTPQAHLSAEQKR